MNKIYIKLTIKFDILTEKSIKKCIKNSIVQFLVNIWTENY